MTTDEDGVEVRGGIIPFWNAAPPEDSVRSWERRRERERQQGRGTEGQQRKDMERKRLTGSNKKKKNSALLLQTCGGDGEAGAQTGMR